MLFKRFADIDSIDLEVVAEDPDEFINCVKLLGKSWGGINLEDIKAPECFIIEQRLRELLDIPVFHDDQHGTAIIAAAGLINALDLTGRDIKTTKLVCNGAGAAGIACLELLKAIGFTPENLILCDTKGVIYQGRTDGMNQWKSAHAVKTSARTLAEALVGADVFFGLSVKGAVTKDMVKSMAPTSRSSSPWPIPIPEITAEEVAEVRDDAIMATGRSDYPNQINNVLGFPYIFRGALDVRATTINMEMKIAAAHALAELAREDVPDEVAAAYGARPKFGPDYIIPVPFDPRLISYVPPAVAKAAMDTGVARKPIVDMDAYREQLRTRRDPVAGVLQRVFERLRRRPKRVVFAEGEEEQVIRAAASFVSQGLGTALLVGREDRVRESARGPRHRARRRHRDHQCARCRSATPTTPPISTSACSARASCSATASAWSTRTATISPPAWWRSATPTPWSPASPATSRSRSRTCAAASIPSPAIASSASRSCWRAAAPCWSPTPRSPKCRTPRASPRSRSRPPASRAGFGYEPRLALLAFSTFGHPPGERAAHVQEAVQASSTSAASISNTTARWRPTSRSTWSCARLSVLPAVGPGQRADHAGVPLRLDLDQDAAGARRRDRDRPAAGRARPAGADRAALGQGRRSSSTWRRWRRSM